jgi:bifunctional non-homologous end joining protein LigD
VRRGAASEPGAEADPPLVELVGRIPTGVHFTNLDKVLFAGQGLTKAALVAYYAVVADAMLPHLAGRPLTLVRCPNGAGTKCFFQKHPKQSEPAAIRRLPLREEDGEVEDYMVVDDRDGLFACAQVGALELHVWGSHEATVEKPSRIVFDLDPDERVAFDDVVAAARRLRDELGELGLETFVMTTGGKGLHVIAPLAPRVAWGEAKQFTKDLVERIAAREPRLYTTSPRKAHRRGRIFLDYLRNGRGATAVCPFSTRARPDATVAAPVTWDELDAGATGADFTVQTMPRRLDRQRRDPWEGFFTIRQQITAAARRAVRGAPR